MHFGTSKPNRSITIIKNSNSSAKKEKKIFLKQIQSQVSNLLKVDFKRIYNLHPHQATGKILYTEDNRSSTMENNKVDNIYINTFV